MVREFEGLEQFTTIRAQWDQLFNSLPVTTITSSWWWIACWWETMGVSDRGYGTGELIVFGVYDGKDQLVGGLACHHKFSAGKVGLRGAYPFGLKLLLPAGMLDHRDIQALTEEPTHLVRPEGFEAILSLLQRAALDYARRKRLDAFIFEVERPIDKSAFELIRLTGKRHFLGYATTYSGCYLRELPASWAELRNSLSKKVKDKISYAPRFIERSELKPEFQIHRDPVEFSEALQQVFRLHRSRAELHSGRTHFNYFEHDNQSCFIDKLATQLNAEDKAFVATLRLNGQLVAAQLFLEHQNAIIVTYSGFNPDFHKYSPLFVLVCEVLKDAIARKVDRVNFLQAGEEYQTRWKAAPSTLNHFVFVSKRPISMIRMLAFVAMRRYRSRTDRAHAGV